MPSDVERGLWRVDERGAEGAARNFLDLVVLVCWQPRRPSAGMVDGVLGVLGPKK